MRYADRINHSHFSRNDRPQFTADARRAYTTARAAVVVSTESAKRFAATVAPLVIRARIEAARGDGVAPEATAAAPVAGSLPRSDARADVASSERVEPAGDDRSQPGFVLYEDAGGTVRRAPIADWISFMARRLFSVAEGELDRGFNAACANEADQDANALYDRLRRHLRVDALYDLAYHSQDVFDASRDYAVGARRRYEGSDADLIALGREFDAAHEAWRKAVEANKEPSGRYTAAIEAAQARGGPTMADFRAAQALPGVMEATDAEETAFETAGELSLAILKLPARTLADLAVQARAVIPHVWATGTYEKDGVPDADENIDKEAVRSLIESCCAAAGVDWRGSTGMREAGSVAAHGSQSNSVGDLFDRIDFSTMPMRTLDTLHDHAVVLGDISYGLAAQPRSRPDDDENQTNEAGDFVVRLAEALGAVADRCVDEVRRRQPDSVTHREIRIKTLAQATLENGDAAETRAFAYDLLALVGA